MNNLTKKLDLMKGKKCIIELGGFIEAKIEIKNMDYIIENDILVIYDIENKNKINLNLNQVYKIQDLDLSLDNDLKISII